jgi:hypothetical protein
MMTVPNQPDPTADLRAALRAQLAASPQTAAQRRQRQGARNNLDRQPYWARWQYRGWPQPAQEYA